MALRVEELKAKGEILILGPRKIIREGDRYLIHLSRFNTLPPELKEAYEKGRKVQVILILTQ